MPRQIFTGQVISQGKMNQTIKVQIPKMKWNRLVSKYLSRPKVLLVHDEQNKCREGDVVKIQYVRPLSTRKSWAVTEIMKLKGSSWEKYLAETPDQVAREELAKLQEFKREGRESSLRNGEDALVQALRELRASANATEGEPQLSAERIAEVKAKYQLESIDSEKVSLEVFALEADLWKNFQETKISESALEQSKRLVADEPTKADELIKGAGHDPTSLKNSVKRNILAKLIRTNAVAV